MKNTLILTSALMRQCDEHTIHTLGIPSQVLMERAAQGVVDYMNAHTEAFPFAGGGVLVLCGSGNNGGDGFAAARLLFEGGHRRITVCYGGRFTEEGLPDKKKMSVECARQFELLAPLSLPVLPPKEIGCALASADMVIDALFGVGLDRPIVGDLAALIDRINRAGKAVLSVDMPSGIHGDTGAVMGTAIQATATVTMQALKQGLLLYPGADHAGHIHVCELGIDLTPAAHDSLRLAEQQLIEKVLPPRRRRSHKGTYGRLALLCGSRGMAGAAILAAKGALRSGAGLVSVITPECNCGVLQSVLPEAIVSVYGDESPRLGELTAALRGADGVVMGCGLGTSATSLAVLETLLTVCPVTDGFPVVLDADALNLLAKHPRLWEIPVLREGAHRVVLTPHPAEMSRLTGMSVAEILDDPIGAAGSLAASRGVTVLLKDAHTVIASPQGEVYLSPFGHAGMAKGGSGDVLAGILGALAVQSRGRMGGDLTLTEIAAAAAALHGMAGDLASETWGEISMTPSDLADALTQATAVLSHTRTCLSFG